MRRDRIGPGRGWGARSWRPPRIDPGLNADASSATPRLPIVDDSDLPNAAGSTRAEHEGSGLVNVVSGPQQELPPAAIDRRQAPAPIFRWKSCWY